MHDLESGEGELAPQSLEQELHGERRELSMDSITRSLGEHQICYSAEARYEARTCMEKSRSLTDPVKKDDIFLAGFDDIASMARTPGETALAKLGISLSSTLDDFTSCVNAHAVVMNAIATGVSGTVGSVLAGIAYSASLAVEKPGDRREILRHGFSEILASPSTGARDKALASLGATVMKIASSEPVDERIGTYIIKALEEPQSRALELDIASAAYEIAKIFRSRGHFSLSAHSDMNIILRHGFEVIAKSPDPDEKIKELASKGLQAGYFAVTFQGAAEDSLKIMEEIREYLRIKEISRREIEAMARRGDSRETCVTITEFEEDEQVLDIGGTRLKIKELR